MAENGRFNLKTTNFPLRNSETDQDDDVLRACSGDVIARDRKTGSFVLI